MQNWVVWLIVAGVLLITELLTYTLFFLAIAVGALMASVVTATFPGISLGWSTLVFSFTSLSALAGWKAWQNLRRDKRNQLNDIYAELVNQSFTLKIQEEDGSFRETLAGTQWRVIGKDLDIGDKVRVVRVEGTKLIVEKVKSATE